MLGFLKWGKWVLTFFKGLLCDRLLLSLSLFRIIIRLFLLLNRFEVLSPLIEYYITHTILPLNKTHFLHISVILFLVILIIIFSVIQRDLRNIYPWVARLNFMLFEKFAFWGIISLIDVHKELSFFLYIFVNIALSINSNRKFVLKPRRDIGWLSDRVILRLLNLQLKFGRRILHQEPAI